MTEFVPTSTRSAVACLRAAAAAAAVLAGCGCLLLAGCSSAGPSAAPAPSGAVHAAISAPGVTGAPAAAQGAASAPGQPRLAALAASQSIIYRASLTVRAADVRAAASRAASLATAAGGYVSSESTRAGHSRRAGTTIFLQLKIPAGRYQATLATLDSTLGTRLSLSQQAQDVTLTVADVSSRVASAQAAIAALRGLLARAGSVTSLLAVQDQINAEEASLEALQSQQRALAHETSYGTVSVLLLSRQTPPAGHPVKITGGFASGLAAGWRALRQLASWLLTGIGAVLPFTVFVIAAIALGVRGRRWLARRRAGPAQPAE
jgi:Domain of unknown function (DUF4349)